jgi:DNA polymerase I-like protein with 3'-5' exonuclease and polymerase domains
MQQTQTNNLFGEGFEIQLNTKNKAKAAIEKAKKAEIKEQEPEKILKSKKISLEDRLDLIKTKVLAILGKQKDNVITIRDTETLHNYINKAIEKGVIAIDTETNNSLDPVTCKLMGPCLYVPGEKQAYIPINHINNETGELLENQLTEEQCRVEFQRILDNKVYVIMHNGKFDYEVIKCTCGIEIPPNWDTMVAARLLDENELAGLKYQYTTKIDPSQQKYDIEGLFENVFYAQLDPELFALYAATDSMMTYKLWEYQVGLMNDPQNKRLKWLFEEVEMPIVVVTAEMELVGVTVDVNFGEKLKEKYGKQLESVDTSIQEVLDSLYNIIEDWKLSPEANKKSKQFEPKKSKKSRAEIEAAYPLIDKESGLHYKEGKSLSLQLSDPINLASPTQLAILFYDVLGCESPDEKNKRGTGEDQLKGIKDDLEKKLAELELKPNYEKSKAYIKASGAMKLCSLILDRRGIVKLITTYIDVIPELAKHWPDGRIRFHLNANGTDTGRYSSGGKIKYVENGVPVTVSGINIQNIPSHNKDIRMLFVAKKDFGKIETTEDYITLPEITEVETTEGWKYGKDLVIGDSLVFDNGIDTLKNIIYNNSEKCYYLYV